MLSACGGGNGSANASIPSGPNAPGAPTGVTPTPGVSPTPSPSSSPVPTQSNLLYVSLGTNQSSQANPHVSAFALNSGGNVAPVKTISQYQNDMPSPTALAFDAGGNLYVGNICYPGLQGSTDFISVFAAGANGNAAPIRTIGTGLRDSTIGKCGLEAMGVDASGYLYVAESAATSGPNIGDEILVFAPNSSGTMPAVRTIQSSACFRIGGLAVMPSGSLIVSCMPSGTAQSPYPGEIETFSSGASGNAIPTNVIAGSNTQLSGVGAVTLSPLGFVVVRQPAQQQSGSLLTFPQSASGNVAPTTVVTGPSTQLTYNGGIGNAASVAVDATGNIYVLNGAFGVTPYITEYSASANGNAAPINVISGSSTTMDSSGGQDLAIGPP